MTQRSLHWNGASLGDAQDLTVNADDGIGWRLANEDYSSPFVDLGLRMILNGDENRGVLKGWDNELVVAGVATPVTVGTGAGIVYGMPYRNHTAAVNVAVPSPTSDTRIDRIVLRRDWAAQTIRITRLVGVEGGGVPAMTQSPAPTGSGVYDIPLAYLSITTGGVITVTDEREWCTFSTVPVDDSLVTAHFTNESADLAARETRTKRAFIGGGDWEPVAGGLSYTATDVLALTGGSTWGSAAASEEGWQAAGASYGYMGTFKLPDDYASGDVTCYLWWMDDGGAALSFYWRTCWHAMPPGGAGIVYSGDYTNTLVSGTFAAGEAYRADAETITGVTADDLIYYACKSYLAGAGEPVLFLGLELEYTGYL